MKQAKITADNKSGLAPGTRITIVFGEQMDGGPRELSWPCSCCGKLQLFESPFSYCPTCSQELAQGY